MVPCGLRGKGNCIKSMMRGRGWLLNPQRRSRLTCSVHAIADQFGGNDAFGPFCSRSNNIYGRKLCSTAVQMHNVVAVSKLKMVRNTLILFVAFPQLYFTNSCYQLSDIAQVILVSRSYISLLRAYVLYTSRLTTRGHSSGT